MPSTATVRCNLGAITVLLAALASQASCTCGTTPEKEPQAKPTTKSAPTKPTSPAAGKTPKAGAKAEAPSLLPGPRNLPRGRSLFTGTSEFSKMRVVQNKTLRTLEFIKDGGKRMRQTSVDVTAPYTLQYDYAKAMFASLVLRPAHDRVLLVGLGGGGMVHFLNHFFPETKVDIVDIDPVVVQVAREWFGIDNSEQNTVFTADGVAHIDQAAPHSWDVIYMDVFLKPTAEGTNSAGVPKTTTHRQFLERLRKRLRPGGLLVFHMHHKSDTQLDIATIEAVFPQVRRVRRGSNIVVYASGGELPSAEVMTTRAKELDEAADHGFSFTGLTRVMEGSGLTEHKKAPATKAPPTRPGVVPPSHQPTPPNAPIQ